MKIDADRFRVRPGERVRLKQWPTRVKPCYASKADYQERLARHVEQMAELQNLLYADDRYALLLIFQAMDAAGKDSCIKHVMSGVNPQGCQVYSFKHPSAEELDHDFLWRCMRALPERGRIGIFNRSYYEEVLIVRVHPEILRAQKVPRQRLDGDEAWEQRYRSIADLEAHLERNGTRVVKFFLHVSKDEQRKRFLSRIDEAERNWKFSRQDVEERKYWKDYMRAYAACLEATSTRRSPWYVVPADDKPNARLIVSRIIVETLKRLDMAYPQPDAKRRRELLALRKLLAK
jgi:PPK2 family polyphosphate:nucleotide phosphotransferase